MIKHSMYRKHFSDRDNRRSVSYEKRNGIRRYEDALDSLRHEMSPELIADLKVARKAGNHRAEIICLNHRSEIADILKRYGVEMYDTPVSFYDFRGGYDSLARDILLCADIDGKDAQRVEQRIARRERLVKEDNNNLVEVVRWSSMNYDGEVIGTANSAKEACSVIVKDLLEIDDFYTAAKKVWLPERRYSSCGWGEHRAIEEDESGVIELYMDDEAPCYTLRRKSDNDLYAMIVLSASMIYDVSFYQGEPTYVDYGSASVMYDDGSEVEFNDCYLSVDSADTDEYSDDTLNSWAEEIVNSLLEDMYPHWD